MFLWEDCRADVRYTNHDILVFSGVLCSSNSPAKMSESEIFKHQCKMFVLLKNYKVSAFRSKYITIIQLRSNFL